MVITTQSYGTFSLFVSAGLAFLFHSVVILFSFMKCNYLSTNVMSTEGACQKAIRLVLVLLRCQVQYALIF